MAIDRLVTEEVSGSTAKTYVADISRFHRIQASPMFHEAAEYIKSELKRLGLDEARIEQFPADGKHKYWTYTSPIGWEVRSAQLTLVAPETRQLASYQDIPQSLHTFSKGTPKGGIVAELVDVGSGVETKDYAGKKVKGKIVLATGRAKLVQEQAVFKRGAVGVITDSLVHEFPGVRETVDVPDAHAYQGLWPTAKELDRLAFGFSLSRRQGNQLRKLLRTGKKVRLKAVVDARLFPSHEDVVTATIRGSEMPKEEVFVIGHLCHPKPGANDNASGSGAVLEVARTLTSLIQQQKIPGPKRSIRFLWVPETLGTVAYLSSHEDIPSRFLAGINLDMVGEDQDQCGSILNMTRTPDSLPSFMNDYLPDVFDRSSKALDRLAELGLGTRFRFAASTFSAGSDHAEFTNSTTQVPCVSFTQWPDKFYHTSMDTLDKVSEDSMRRIAWIASVAILELANAGPEQVFMFVGLVASRGAARIKEAGTLATKSLMKAVENETKNELPEKLMRVAQESRARILHIAAREKRAVASAEVFGKDLDTTAFVKRCQSELGEICEQEISKLDEVLAFVAKRTSTRLPGKARVLSAVEALRRISPDRLFKGTLSLDLFRERLGDDSHAYYRKLEGKDRDFDSKMTEILNYMDGERTGAEILEAVTSEFGGMEPEAVLRLLKDLKKAGLVTFR